MIYLALVVLALPWVAAIVVACIREPMRVALPMFAALIPFGGALAIGSSPFSSLSSLMGLLLVVSLGLQVISSRPSSPRIPSDLPVWILFLGVAAATILWTVDATATLKGVLVLGSLAALYVLAALAPVDRTAVRRTENALILGAVASVIYGLVQLLFLGGFPAHAEGEGPSPTGRFGNDLLEPNLQAVSMLLPLAIALNRTFAPGGTWTRRWLHGAVALLMLLGILMTGSRGGLLAAGVTVAALIVAGRPQARKRLLLFSALGVVAAAMVWIYHPWGLATREIESTNPSSGRTDIWEVGAAACREHCLYGSGWGTFPTVYAETQPTVPGARVLAGDGHYQPHNVFLLVVVELGFLGLLLLACGFGLAMLEARKLSPGRRGPPVSALAGLLTGVMFLSSLEFKFFWMVLIMVVINRNLEVREAAGTPDLQHASNRTAGPAT